MLNMSSVADVYFWEFPENIQTAISKTKSFQQMLCISLGKGNLIFCCTSSRENCIGSVGRQNNNNNNNNNNNPKFQGRHI